MKKITACMAVAVLILTASCSRPSRQATTIDMLDYTYNTLRLANFSSGNVERFREFYKTSRDGSKINHFTAGSSISIESTYGEIVPGCIMRSIPGNALTFEQPVFITEGRKNEALLSLDGETWYTTRNDFDRGVENFKNRYYFNLDYQREKKYLSVIYRYSIVLDDILVQKPVREKRPVREIEAGMVFKDADKSRINYDLQHNIVHIPAGTVVQTDFIVLGNLITCSREDQALIFHVLKDMYFYQKGMRFGLSFNNEDWDLPFFDFQLRSFVQVKARSESYITAALGLLIRYLR